MYTFIQYLNEKTFAKGRDVDFTVDDKLVLCFVESDQKTYKPTGDKTHDASSHAIKHLGEFEPVFMKFVLQSAKDYIKSYIAKNPTQFVGLLSTSGSFQSTGSEALSKADLYMIGNTFDLINDKVLTKNSLVQIEKDLLPFIKKIREKYTGIVDDKMKRAVNLDKVAPEELESSIKKASVIKFDGWQKIAQEYYLDFSDNSIIICTPDYIRTLYRFDRDASSKRDVIKNFFSKKFEVDNKKIANILKTL